MKIIVTPAEAIEIIRRQLGLDDKTVIEISNGGVPSVLDEVMRVLSPFMNFDGTEVRSDQKISAIKALRQYQPSYGLADAKDAIVDSWPSFIGFVKEHNRLPKRSGWGVWH